MTATILRFPTQLRVVPEPTLAQRFRASLTHAPSDWQGQRVVVRNGRHFPGRESNLDLVSEISDEPKKEPPMVKMVVRDEKPKEQVIEWWLEQGLDGCIAIRAGTPDRSEVDTVAVITRHGRLARVKDVGHIPGLDTDDTGRIKLAE